MLVYPFPRTVEKQLINYNWPGNVRMLENVIVRSLILQKEPGPLDELIFNNETDVVSHFTVQKRTETMSCTEPLGIRDFIPGGALADKLEAFERQLVTEALKKQQGCVAKAARELNISRGALQYKIKKYGITFILAENISKHP